MSRTDNGYNVLDATASLATIRVESHTTKVRRGAVAVILGWLARQLHYGAIERVETVFGWRSRATNSAAGGVITSNHLSGTAIDYNGGRHPYERTHPHGWRSGWNAAQIRQIRALLRFLAGTVVWGLDFGPGWRDGMHFAIRGTEPALARVVDKLNGGTVKVTVAGLACRTAPTTSSKVKARRDVGYSITYTEVMWRQGRLWLLSTGGNYYAADCTSIAGV